MKGSGGSDGARRGGRSRRVLVIEDNRDAAELLAMCLAIEGFETLLAYDGENGLEVARRDRPGVVVCDLGLPSLGGCEFARALREEPGFKDCFLVAATGYEDDGRAARAGFDHCVAKPIDVEALIALLHARCGVEG